MKLLKRIGISIITLALVAGVMSPAISAYAANNPTKASIYFKDELEVSDFIKNQADFNGHSLRTIGGDWSVVNSAASDYWVNEGYIASLAKI